MQLNVIHRHTVASQIAKFMGPTWSPPWFCRPKIGPMVVPWILLSGFLFIQNGWSMKHVPGSVSMCISSIWICIIMNMYHEHINIILHRQDYCFFDKKTRDCYRNHIRGFMWLNSELCFCTRTTIFIIVIKFYDYNKTFLDLSWVVSNDIVELNSWPFHHIVHT